MATVAIGQTPIELIATESLTAGTYRFQNLGPGTLRVHQVAAAIADPDKSIGGYRFKPGDWFDVTFVAGEFIYMYAEEPFLSTACEYDVIV